VDTAEVVSQAIRAANTRRSRFQVRARPSYWDESTSSDNEVKFKGAR